MYAMRRSPFAGVLLAALVAAGCATQAPNPGGPEVKERNSANNRETWACRDRPTRQSRPP